MTNQDFTKEQALENVASALNQLRSALITLNEFHGDDVAEELANLELVEAKLTERWEPICGY